MKKLSHLNKKKYFLVTGTRMVQMPIRQEFSWSRIKNQSCCKNGQTYEYEALRVSIYHINCWLFWNPYLKRSIFQTFWKANNCTYSLFLELETSNFGYLLIFWFPSTVHSVGKIGQHWYKAPPPLWIFGKLQNQKTSNV